jgi:hypothetical protein
MRCPKYLIATMTIVAALQISTAVLAASGERDWSDSVGGALDSLANTLMAPFTDSGIDQMMAPPMSLSQFGDNEGGDRDPFWQHLKDAGYAMKQIEAHDSLIHGLKFKFVLKRELSEADRDSLERKLEIDNKRRPGLISAIKRRIIRTLIEASDFEAMQIEELGIYLLPLPAAEFVLSPVEGPLGEEHDVLYRSIQNMQRQTEDLQRTMGIKGAEARKN